MSWPFTPTYKKLKRNPNLSMSRYRRYRGLPVIDTRGPLVPEYLDSIMLTMDRSLADHPETTMMRFDLRFPYWFDAEDVKRLSTEVISSFWASLEAQLKAFVKKMKKQGYWFPGRILRDVWCKEVKDAEGKPHYHCGVFIPTELYWLLADRFQPVSLEGMIKEAWARTIHVPVYEAPHAVYVPDNPVYQISANNPDSYLYAFTRLSYLAKTATKHFNDGSQWFGCSRS